MKKIKLTQGKFALVDDEDFKRLNRWKWYTLKGKNTWYAVRDIKINNKKVCILMHRVILNLKDNKIYVDHIDRNGLNNQKKNLRICNIQQNNMNRVGNKNTTSEYKGISWDKKSDKWHSYITKNKKTFGLGYYKNK